MSLSRLWELVMDSEAWRAAVHWIWVGSNSAAEQWCSQRAKRWGAAALCFFGKLVMRGIQMKGQKIHWGRSLGIVFPRTQFFIPAPFSWGEGFLSFSLDQKFHHFRAWLVLICKANFIVRTQWTRLQLDAGDSRFSSSFFVWFQDTYHLKGVVSCQSGGSCFSLSAHGPPLFTRVARFPATWSLTPPPAPPPLLCPYLAISLLQQ